MSLLLALAAGESGATEDTSVRFNGSDEGYSRALTGITPSAFTFCGWAYIVEDRGTEEFQPLFNAVQDLSNHADAFLAWYEPDVDGFAVGSYKPTGGDFVGGATAPPVGEWFFYYMRSGGAGLQSGWRRPADSSWTTSGCALAGSAQFDILRINYDTFDNWSNRRQGAFYIYDSALSDVELLSQMGRLAPVEAPWAWYPFNKAVLADNAIDQSGNNRNLTPSGTLAVENGSPFTVEGGGVTATYLGSQQGDTWPATTITGSIDVGDVNATKQVVIFLSQMDIGCEAVSGTIGAEALSIDIIENNSENDGDRRISVLRVSLPTQSGSQAFSITVTPYTGGHVLSFWAINGASTALVEIDTQVNSTASAINGDIQAVENGLVLVHGNHVGGPYDWLEATQSESYLQDFLACVSGYYSITSDDPAFFYEMGPFLGGNAINLVGLSFAPLSEGSIDDIEATSTLSFGPSGTLAGQGTVAGTSPIIVTTVATISGNTLAIGTASLAQTMVGLLLGNTSAIATSPLLFGTTGLVHGAASVLASSNLTFAGQTTGLASGVLQGTAVLGFTSTAVQTGNGSLAGANIPVFTTIGTLSGQGQANATSPLQFASVARLEITVPVIATAALAFTPVSTIRGIILGTASSTLLFEPIGVPHGFVSGVGSSTLTYVMLGTMTGAATILGNSSVGFVSTATQTGHGSLGSSSLPLFNAQGTLGGTGNADGAIGVSFLLLANTSGESFGIGQTSLGFLGSATISGNVPLVSTATIGFASTANGSLSVLSRIGSTGVSFVAMGTGSLNAVSSVGTTGITFTPTAVHTGKGSLAGANLPVFATQGTLSGVGTITGSQPLQLTTQGGILGKTQMVSTAGLVFNTVAVPSSFVTIFGLTSISVVPEAILLGEGLLHGTQIIEFDTSGYSTGAINAIGSTNLTLEAQGEGIGLALITGFTSVSFIGTVVSVFFEATASITINAIGSIIGLANAIGSSVLSFSNRTVLRERRVPKSKINRLDIEHLNTLTPMERIVYLEQLSGAGDVDLQKVNSSVFIGLDLPTMEPMYVNLPQDLALEDQPRPGTFVIPSSDEELTINIPIPPEVPALGPQIDPTDLRNKPRPGSVEEEDEDQ